MSRTVSLGLCSYQCLAHSTCSINDTPRRGSHPGFWSRRLPWASPGQGLCRCPIHLILSRPREEGGTLICCTLPVRKWSLAKVKYLPKVTHWVVGVESWGWVCVSREP